MKKKIELEEKIENPGAEYLVKGMVIALITLVVMAIDKKMFNKK